MRMNGRKISLFALLSFFVGSACFAQQAGMAKPELLLKEQVQGMPKGEVQEVRVLTAQFKPGDKTPFHTHRFPVTVYVLEGAFTLEWRAAPRSPSGPGRPRSSRRMCA